MGVQHGCVPALCFPSFLLLADTEIMGRKIKSSWLWLGGFGCAGEQPITLGRVVQAALLRCYSSLGVLACVWLLARLGTAYPVVLLELLFGCMRRYVHVLATWRNPELGMHREVINGLQVVGGLNGAPECVCTIDSVLWRERIYL